MGAADITCHPPVKNAVCDVTRFILGLQAQVNHELLRYVLDAVTDP